MTEINNWMPGTFADVAYPACRGESVSLPLPSAIRPFSISDDSDVESACRLLLPHPRTGGGRTCNSFGGNSRPGGSFRGNFRQRRPPPDAPQEAALKAAQADRDAIVALGGEAGRAERHR